MAAHRLLQTLLLGFWLLSSTTVAADWEIAKEKNGITVWTSSSDDLPINRFRAETVLDHPITAILSALRDVDRYSEWMSDCREGRVLSSIDDDNYNTYMRWNMPFPFRDREFVQQVQITIGDNNVEMNVSPIPDELPLNEKYVRVRSAQIQWQLSSLKDSQTKVIQTGYANPAGKVPTSMVNRFVESGPYQTMLELKAWLNRDRNNS